LRGFVLAPTCGTAKIVMDLPRPFVSWSYPFIRLFTAKPPTSWGDGEAPAFAEALEVAGTYVESYRKIQNGDLITEEVRTLAGGIIQVDVGRITVGAFSEEGAS
jgi:hypothetical protein